MVYSPLKAVAVSLLGKRCSSSTHSLPANIVCICSRGLFPLSAGCSSPLQAFLTNPVNKPGPHLAKYTRGFSNRHTCHLALALRSAFLTSGLSFEAPLIGPEALAADVPVPFPLLSFWPGRLHHFISHSGCLSRLLSSGLTPV